MNKRKFKLLIFFLLFSSLVLIAEKGLADLGYDRCEYGEGWSEPQSAAQNCGWGYYQEGFPKYGYVKDCCCCYLTSHIHDLGGIFENKKVLIEYQPGWAKGCVDTMTISISTDNRNWREILSHRVIQPTWNPKTTFQEEINIYGEFRYIKISIPHCYNDYSSAKIIGDLPLPEDYISGTLSLSNNSVCVGENVTFTISAQDDQGVEKVCIKKEGGLQICELCNGSTFCTKNIKVTENNPGIYRFYGILYGKKVNNSQEIGETNPPYIDVRFNQCCQHHAYKQCYEGNVYWFDSCGNKEDLFENCGNSGWIDEYKCLGNIVQRKWQNTSCSNAQCILNEEWKDFENCSEKGEICQNGQCIAKNNHPAFGTLFASRSSLYIGEYAEITIRGSDEDGLEKLCLFYQNSWHCQNVSGSSASFNWNITENTAGNYNFCGKVYGKTPNNETEVSETNPSCITISFLSSNCPSCNSYYYYYYQNQNHHLGCYLNDVYWFDQYGNRLNKYQECGENYSSDWSEPYCENNGIFKKRINYKRGCQDGSCYERQEIEKQLVKLCLQNQICENGECKEKIECKSGPCCENGKFKPSSAVCDVEIQTQYGCPWGVGCGYDVGKRTRSRFRYCSGNSSDCTGKWGEWSQWSLWQVSDFCSFNEVCSPGNSKCQYSSNCIIPSSSSYIKYYSKQCKENKLYWIDSEGKIQDLYRDCSDGNSCTLDSCENGKCLNNLYCDGTTCSIGSEDYCIACNHCGDNVCNCQENENNCPQDCLSPTFCISGFARKNEKEDWKDTIEIEEGEEIEILFSLCNSENTTKENFSFKVDFPEGIIFEKNSLFIGEEKKENLNPLEGISLAKMDPYSRINILFKARIKELKKEKEYITGIISDTEGKSKRNYILLVSSPKASSLLASIFLGNSFIKWFVIFLKISLVVLAIILLFFGVNHFLEKREEKYKKIILEMIGKKNSS